MNAHQRRPDICPTLNEFAAGTVAAFLDEIADLQLDEPLYKVERRQLLAAHVTDDLNCWCEECMAVDAIAGIVGDLTWSPRDRASMERFTDARVKHFELVKRRLGHA